MDRISALGGECIVGREYHEDGGIHLHVFCDFGRKFRSRKTDVFDVGGFHPNIEKIARTPAKAFDYAIKDGDVICGGLGRPSENSPSSAKTDQKWAEITSAEDRASFWELVHRLDPKAAACNFTSLSKYCDWKFAPDAPEYESPSGVGFDEGEFDGRADWLRQSGIGAGGSFRGEFPQIMRSEGSTTPIFPLPSGGPLFTRGLTTPLFDVHNRSHCWRRRFIVGAGWCLASSLALPGSSTPPLDPFC